MLPHTRKPFPTALLNASNKLGGVEAEYVTERKHFRDVYPSFTALAFTHKCLSLSEVPCNFLLRSCLFASSTELFQEDFVGCCVDRLWHRRALDAKLQERGSLWVNRRQEL